MENSLYFASHGREGLRDQQSWLESGLFSPLDAGRVQILGRVGFFLPCVRFYEMEGPGQGLGTAGHGVAPLGSGSAPLLPAGSI